MTYTITVCKYGYELMVVNMPEDYTLSEDVERDDVDELGDIMTVMFVLMKPGSLLRMRREMLSMMISRPTHLQLLMPLRTTQITLYYMR